MPKRHALFVAFHVPPEASSSGVLRTLKYIRYLDELGWRVSVIAPHVDAYVTVDSSLEAQLPASATIVRTPFVNTKRHLAIAGRYLALLAVPDTWIGWYPWGVAAGLRVAGADPVDLVYSTSPHATAHLIAGRIAQRRRLPWVTDFRDPWYEDVPEPGAPAGPIFRAIDRRLERRVITRCQRVVSSTTTLRDQFRARYPVQPADKFVAIANGYDEADFAALPEPATVEPRLTIVHAGGINAEFRDPRPLFAVVRDAIDAGKLGSGDIRLRFLGGGAFADSVELKRDVERYALADVVEFRPRVPYADALRELASADVLLLLQASADTVGLVPAKLYEYMRARKPVLALVQPGATGEVMASVHGGWAVDPADAAALAKTLTEIVRRWRDGSLAAAGADPALLRRYDRKTLTHELAAVFEAACTANDGEAGQGAPIGPI